MSTSSSSSNLPGGGGRRGFSSRGRGKNGMNGEQTAVGTTGRRARGPQTTQVGTSTPPPDPTTNHPPPATDPKEAMMSDMMKKLAITEVVGRPGYGSLGRPIQLNANYFSIQFPKTLVVQRYDIQINKTDANSARKIDKDEQRDLFWRCVKENQGLLKPGRLVFDDSHACFSIDKLAFTDGANSHTFSVRTQLYRDNRPGDYSVRFQFANAHVVDLRAASVPSHDERCLVSLQVIDLIINQGRKCPLLPGSDAWAPWGRSMYRVMTESQAHVDDLGSGRQLWRGFQAAGKVGEGWKPMLNVDVANTAFYKRIGLLEFLVDVLNESAGGGARGGGGGRGGRGGGPRGGGAGGGGGAAFTLDGLRNNRLTEEMKRSLEQNLKGVKLKTKHMDKQNRVYKYTGLGREADQTFFEMTDGKQISVAAYFRDRYGPLNFPHLPCIQVGPKTRNIYIPMECLEVYGPQKVAKKLTDKQTATMIRSSARPPADRKRTIEELMRAAELGKDPFCQNFGLQLQLQMVDAPGRVLDNQRVLVESGKRQVEVQMGEWKYGGATFYQPASCAAYALLSFVGQRQQSMLEAFCKNLVVTCRAMGMQFGEEWPFAVKYLNRADEVNEAMKRVVQENERCQLILVVLPSRNPDIYSAVKQSGDVEMGVMSQCVLSKNAMQVAEKPPGPNAATAVNIAMKINIKMGGITSGLRADQVWASLTQVEKSATLFLGIDVTHPDARDEHSPSIGSVVGNVDLAATRFGANIKVQKHRRETVVYMQDEAKERIMQFFQMTRHKPQRIIIYRDGVSEGQFLTILNEELMGIRNACLALHEDYKPSMTFIVVQKRHHTRLFVKNPREGAGRMGNVPPGTVVDRAITHPCEFDFFLCSHLGIQGTSRPTHYYVLHDECGFSADELQLATFQLCHLYGRCPRVVSIPAPVYFADLCCERARYHVRSKLALHSSESLSTAAAEAKMGSVSEQELVSAVTVNAVNKNQMYFI